MELDTLTSAAEAIKELHGKRMGKRMLNVRYARSRTNFTGDRGSMKKSFKNEREDSQSSYRDRSRDRDRDSGRSRG